MTSLRRVLIVAVMTAGSVGLLAAAPKAEGYLRPGDAPDAIRILPPPPPPGSPAAARDRAAFVATRAFQGTSRWTAAAHDDKIGPLDVLADFNCATGVALDELKTPILAQLFARVRIDSSAVVGPPKRFYARPRPYVGTGAPICVAETEDLRGSPDYPSGHATYGWAAALVLAEIDPAHATAILERGREYGESRVICGVHSPSAVDAGRTNGALLVATLHGNQAFRDDVDAARRELAGLTRSTTAACAVEAKVLAAAAY
ncbi:phosphatase PAP2 family protein (plasmid) [Polymorphobacter sp. PAMC 29334]|uniref:acid phosphatase n=1 Tax=Polymorphobacter sp. PAMC 29334 TaxID=2862331 RepID=UPI001C669001|nr:phosphatase PAP2 family protein [Polymorphobacter sp. PAMC 29334]QYE37275.1 phosphatase PAP2 family protein [Polymorphobacter sp. PAMC 29334]